jgi:regulator of protease activity HflC (stomatin/prohibitin superfamily)
MFALRQSSNRVLTRDFHMGFLIVSQQTAVIIERFGKYNKTLDPGFHLLIPFIDRDAYYHSLKEEVYPISSQMAITRDNVTIHLDGVLYLKVVDPYKASYGVGNPVEAMTQLAQTTMRSELGKLTFDKTFEERESLNHSIVNAINEASMHWGIECMRYEIRDISPPANIRKAMELQAEAERQKRAEILASEGKKQAEINLAEGKRAAAILKAEGEAKAILTKADATAQSIDVLSNAILNEGGTNAVKLRIAEQYVEAFSNLAKKNNTMIIPTQPQDIGSTISQALGIYESVGKNDFSPVEKADK